MRAEERIQKSLKETSACSTWEAALLLLPQQLPAPPPATPALHCSIHRAASHHASTQAPRAEAIEKGRLLVMEGGRWDEGGQGHEEVPRAREVCPSPLPPRRPESTPDGRSLGRPPRVHFADCLSRHAAGRTTTPTTKYADKSDVSLTSSLDCHLPTRFEQSIKTSFSPSCTTWASSIEERR